MQTALFHVPTVPLQSPHASPIALRGRKLKALAASLVILASLPAAAVVLAPTPAAAQAGRALELWNQIAADEQAVTAAIAEVRAFRPKGKYCTQAEKDADYAKLEQLRQNAANAISRMTVRRAALVQLVANDARALSVFEKAASGAQSDLMNDAAWNQHVGQLRTTLSQAYDAAKASIDKIPVKSCAPVDDDKPVALTNPLSGMDIGMPPAPSGDAPTVPERFCHLDEKQQAVDRFAEAIYSLDSFLQELDVNYIPRLNRYRATVVRLIAEARANADKAARANKPKQLESYRQQLERNRQALKTIDDEIAAARALYARVTQQRADLEAAFQRVRAAKVVDCLGDAEVKTAIGTLVSGAGGLADPVLQEVNIPSPVPDQVCTEAEKNRFIIEASQAWSAAARNRGVWEDRVMATDKAMRRGQGDQAELQRAREEARLEHNKAKKVADKAQEALDRAFAIKVVPCEPDGKLIEKLDGAGGNPAGQDRMGGDNWGTPGENGNQNGDGVLTPPRDGAFDGSEAERAIHERLQDAHRSEERRPAQPGHHTVDPPAPPTPQEPRPTDGDAADELGALLTPNPPTTLVAVPGAPTIDPAPVERQPVEVQPDRPSAPTSRPYPDCPTHPGMPGTPEHIRAYHS